MPAPQIVRGSRLKGAGLTALSALFVASGFWMAQSERSTTSLFVVGFFGLCFLVGAAMTIWPATLKITDEGFTCRMLFRQWSAAWRDIDEMFLWSNPAASQKLVAWSYKPGCGPTGPAVKMSAAFGAPGALPGSWTISPQQLLDLLQERRAASMPHAG